MRARCAHSRPPTPWPLPSPAGAPRTQRPFTCLALAEPTASGSRGCPLALVRPVQRAVSFARSSPPRQASVHLGSLLFYSLGCSAQPPRSAPLADRGMWHRCSISVSLGGPLIHGHQPQPQPHLEPRSLKKAPSRQIPCLPVAATLGRPWLHHDRGGKVALEAVSAEHPRVLCGLCSGAALG